MSAHRISGWIRRLRQIFAFACTGSTPIDFVKLVVIGYARGHDLSGPGWISKMGRHLFPRITVRIRKFHGLKLILDPSSLSQLVILDEILIENIYDLSRVPFPPDLILDCGAHIGIFTIHAAGMFSNSRLIAFEPDPENFNWLREQAETNRLEIDLIPAAVSISDGEANFIAGGGCGGSLVEASSTSPNLITVQTVDLAGYIERRRCKKLLLKLDVEGEEEAVLPIMIKVLPNSCCIFFETHGGEESWSRCCALLQAHGFAVEATRRHDLYVDGFAIRHVS
jgi:FkbM family methyltransferase